MSTSDRSREGEDADAQRHYSHDTLTKVGRVLFEAAGSPADEAERVAGLLVASNLAGHDSHGVVRIPQYLRNVRRGHVVPGRGLKVSADHGSVVLTRGQYGYGQMAAHEATEMLRQRAKAHGVAAVAVAEMNHCGRLADYCRQGAEGGVLTLMFAASGGFNALMAPFGGAARRMNTNPIGVGIPHPGKDALVFDIATSATSQGRVKVAVDARTAMPPDQLLDKDGAPTTDPMALYRGGAILPFGGDQGYKGYLLNFLVEVLGGILTNGGVMGSPKREAGGQCLLAVGVDPAAFRSNPVFADELSRFVAYLKASPTMPGQEVLAPGEISRRTEARRRKEGIPLPPATAEALEAELDASGLSRDVLVNVQIPEN